MSGGLSTLNFMQGAMEGYRFMDERKDKQLNRARQLRQDEMAETDQKVKHGLYEVQADAARTRAETDKLKLQYAREDRPDEIEQRKKENQQKDTEHDLRRQNLEKGNAALEQQKLRDKVTADLAKMNIDALKDEGVKRQIKMMGDYYEAQDAGKEYAITPEEQAQAAAMGLLTPDVIHGEKGAAAKQVFEGVMSGKIPLDDPAVGQVLMVRFPEIQAVAQKNGYNVTNAHLQPVPNQPGKFTIGLEIEGQSELKPLTNGRSTDPNDTVKVVTLDEISGAFESLVGAQKLGQSAYGRELIKALSKKVNNTQDYKDVVEGEIPGYQRGPDGRLYKVGPGAAPGHNTQRDFVKHREVMMEDPHYKFLKRKYTKSTTEDERTAINKEMEDYLLETFYGKVTPKPDGATQNTTDEPEATPSAFTSGAKNTGGRSNNANKLKARQTAPPDVNDFLDKEFKVP